MPNKKMYQGLNMNSNPVTGLAAPTANSDAANKEYVDTKAAVQSVNTKTGAVVLSATDIAISDTNNNFTTDTVQGAIEQLFTSANNGKTSIASAIGSPAEATDTFTTLAGRITTGKGQIADAIGAPATSSDTFTTLAGYVTALSTSSFGVEKLVEFDESVDKGDPVEAYYKKQSLTKLSPGVTPEGDSYWPAWSPDGKQLAIAHGVTPFLSIFNFNESTNSFSEFANPATAPTNTGQSVAWSPNNDYLAVAHSTAPTITVYVRNGEGAITKTPSGSNLPTPAGSTGRSVAWSPDSNFLALATSGTPGMNIYFRTGTTFTMFASTVPTIFDVAPTANGLAVAFSPNGNYIYHGHASGFNVYKKNGNTSSATFTRVGITDGFTVDCKGAMWSPDGQYLAVATTDTSTTFGARYLAIYKQTGDTFTRLSSISGTLIEGIGNSVAWSNDSNYLYISFTGSPSLAIFKRSGDTFTRQASPTGANAVGSSTARGVAVHPNNNIISVTHHLTPFHTEYRNDGTYLFTKMGSTVNPLSDVIGIAKENAAAGATNKKVDVISGGNLL